MAISNKDALIFDFWSHNFLLEPYNEHTSKYYSQAKSEVSESDEFILSQATVQSQLLKELYDL